MKEMPPLLRNYLSYDEDLVENDSSMTGLKSECVFKSTESFHATTNSTVHRCHARHT